MNEKKWQEVIMNGAIVGDVFVLVTYSPYMELAAGASFIKGRRG